MESTSGETGPGEVTHVSATPGVNTTHPAESTSAANNTLSGHLGQHDTSAQQTGPALSTEDDGNDPLFVPYERSSVAPFVDMFEDLEEMDAHLPSPPPTATLPMTRYQQLQAMVASNYARLLDEFCGTSIKVEDPDVEVIDAMPIVDLTEGDHATSGAEPARKKAKHASNKPRAARVTKRFERARQERTNFASMGRANLFNDIHRTEGAANQRDFAAGNKVDAVWADLRKNQNFANRDAEREFYADIKLMQASITSLGPPRIKPANNGTWTVPGMRCTLLHHQLRALAFMVKQELTPRPPYGGMVADQMGLGKTVMSLALIVRGHAHTHLENLGQDLRPSKATLVVCPASVVDQWYNEISKHCNTKDNLENDGSKRIKDKVVIKKWMRYKASVFSDEHEDDILERLSEQDIIVASYEQVTKSLPIIYAPSGIIDPYERQAWVEQELTVCKGYLHKLHFHRIILDEAQKIRNPDTATSHACHGLSADFRWVLSGTPMINGVADLWSLYKFIGLPMPVDSYEQFKSFRFKQDADSEHAFQQMVNEAVLQRSYGDVFLNAKLVALPPSQERILLCNLNAVERALYEIVEDRFRLQINATIQAGERIQQGGHIFTKIMILRQLTAHPLLIQPTLHELLEAEDCNKLDKELSKLGAGGRDGPTYSMCHALLLQVKEAMNLGLGGAERDAAAPIGSYGNSAGKYTTTLFKNLRDHAARRARATLICAVCKHEATEPHVTSCGHFYCKACLEEIQQDAACNGESCATCSALDCQQPFSTVEPVADRKEAARAQVGGRKNGRLGLPDGVENLIDSGAPMMTSTKMLIINMQICKWFEEDRKNKIVIFTQWGSMIKIVSNMCQTEKWGHAQYTGQMPREARSQVLEQFEKNDNVRILICGLKVGSLGLNLTMANKVVCADPWYNNATEQQAYGRVYRIGQKKSTAYLQIVVQNTIDTKLQDIKQRKQLEIDDYDKAIKKFSTHELLSLFGRVTTKNGRLYVEKADAEEESGSGDGSSEWTG